MVSNIGVPFSLAYGWVMQLRNAFYDKALFSSWQPDVPVISVGNLTVGGTGKTPMVAYLIERYTAQPPASPDQTATLSRGYGRRTKGFRVASPDDTADTLGDEPLQLYRTYGQRVRVCVGERRADAIRHMQQAFPALRRVLLDDAFQHRAVTPHLNLLLSDYNRPFYTDRPFPGGRLRESRWGARRADAVIVTKCPDSLSAAGQAAIAERIGVYTRPGVPVLFAGLRYGQPTAFATKQPNPALDRVVLVSGLANADPLERYVQTSFSLVHHHRFADHYAYRRTDLDRLLARLPADAALLTTEKDWVKLSALLTPAELTALPLYYLPVAVQFLGESGQAFEALLNAFDARYPADESGRGFLKKA